MTLKKLSHGGGRRDDFSLRFDARRGSDDVEILSMYQEVRAYRCDMSFMSCDKRMC